MPKKNERKEQHGRLPDVVRVRHLPRQRVSHDRAAMPDVHGNLPGSLKDNGGYVVYDMYYNA